MNFKLKLETKKQKITALIIAIVSVILCVAIVLVTVSSCSADTSGGKKIIKKVKKKVIIVQKPDSSATTDVEDNNTYYEIVDEDYDGPEEVIDTVYVPEEPEEETDNSSEEDVSSEDGSKYEVELHGKVPTPLSDKIAIAFYHYKPGNWTAQFADKYGKEGDIVSCCSVANIDDAKLCKEYGLGGWIVPSKSDTSFVDRTTTELTETWKDTIVSTAEAYKAMGLWDVIEGFHFDEPLGYINGEQFRAMTKFLAETFPDKRIYPVFSYYELVGYSPSRIFPKVDYYNCGYVTDVGYDEYDMQTIEALRERFGQLASQIGRKDVRYWVYPATFRWFESTTEDFCLKSLDSHFEMLKEFENPGGMHMYSWKTYTTRTGFSELTDPVLDWKWDRMFNRVLEISKEIKAMKYTYKNTKN